MKPVVWTRIWDTRYEATVAKGYTATVCVLYDYDGPAWQLKVCDGGYKWLDGVEGKTVDEMIAWANEETRLIMRERARREIKEAYKTIAHARKVLGILE